MPALSRRELLTQGLLAGTYALIAPACARIAPSSAAVRGRRRPHVLFIAIDDLRPQLGCYGTPRMRTPHIDALARQGTTFRRAYCQQSICNPSRASLLTGLRPDTTRIYDLQTHFRLHLPDAVTLPQYFKQNGYRTQGLSKIFHSGLDDPRSWSDPHWLPRAATYVDQKILTELEEDTQAALARGQAVERTPPLTDPKTGLVLKLGSRTAVQGPVWESAECSDSQLTDGKTADKAIELLNAYRLRDEPFFLCVGFIRPHLPFVAPRKYFDLYPPESIRLADNPFAPEGAPACAFPIPEEPRAYKDMPKDGPIPAAKQLEVIRAYCACVSYVDAQVGRLIGELDRLGMRENTVICLWGDHGWHLGENAVWGKMTNFERGAHAPLIISAPRQSRKGEGTNALAEFVDIYPTLCELCGLPVPGNLEGTSLVPVMESPNRSWKKAAFSQEHSRRKGIMGYTMRTDRYRYTEWMSPEKALVARELYDHDRDTGENVNLAVKAGNEALVESLSRMLRAGWKAARPE
jgi:iduronate 2-sulfatase